MFKQAIKMLMIPLKFIEMPMVNGILKIFLILYASSVAPKLPEFMSKLLKNSIIKILILFLIPYVGIKDPIMSLMIAIAFTLSMLSLNKLETIRDVHDLLDTVIDVPQEVLNNFIDGTQELVKDSANIVDAVTGKANIRIAGPIVDVANKIVDGVQEFSNKIIDGTQSIVSDIVGTVIKKSEKFSLADPESKVDFEMGKIGDISGFASDEMFEEELVEEKPVEEKPVEEKPVEEKPVEEKPVEEKPVEEKPVEEKPVEEKKL